MNVFRLAAAAVALFACSSAFAQTTEHVAAVRDAQKSAYAISDSTNDCPVVGTDMFGWPGGKIRKCIYEEGPSARRLTGLVYLLDVAPEAIARWIETSCANQLAGVSACFATVLKCGKFNSGMMFPISGNMMENMNPTAWKNYFFRNGMTVSFGGGENGSTNQVTLDRQEALARMEDSSIKSIPTGVTRYWRTLPRQFAARLPDAQAPKVLNSATARQKWLDIARSEFLAALERPSNHLLEAWIAGHPVTLRRAECPEDRDP